MRHRTGELYLFQFCGDGAGLENTDPDRNRLLFLEILENDDWCSRNVIDGQTGFLVPPNNVNEIAEKINFLLDNPDLCQKIGESAYELVINNYTWKNTCKLMAGEINTFLPDTSVH